MEKLDIQEYYDSIFSPHYDKYEVIWDYIRSNFFNGQFNFFKFEIRDYLESL
jgi:hypothetical protein